jgi:hypothetical protein
MIAKVGDKVSIWAYGKWRDGVIVALSPTGARARVEYLSNDKTGRLGERWESVLRLFPRRKCSYCNEEACCVEVSTHGGEPTPTCNWHGFTYVETLRFALPAKRA